MGKVEGWGQGGRIAKHIIPIQTLSDVVAGDLPNITLQDTRRKGDRRHVSNVQEQRSYNKTSCLQILNYRYFLEGNIAMRWRCQIYIQQGEEEL